MRKILTALMLITLALTLSVTSLAAIEDINEDTCTVVKELVKKGTPTVDGVLDGIYTDSMTLKIHGPASSYFISGSSCEDTTATGTVYALHDDEYVYVFFKVVDNTLIKADEEYIEISHFPRISDSVMVRVGDDLEDHFMFNMYDDHHLLYADAHGVRFSAYDDTFGRDTEKLRSANILDDDGKTYYIEMAIPLQRSFKEGEIIQFEFSINDLQDVMDSLCGVGTGSVPGDLASFTISETMAIGADRGLDGDINENTATVINSVVKKYTPAIDGVRDESYAESLMIKLHGPADSYYISGGSCEDTTATGTVWATYDENYVYVMYEVVDKTLTKAPDNYVNTFVHPYLSDSVEVRVGDGGKGYFESYDSDMANSHQLIYADAHGRRLTSYKNMISASDLNGKAVIDEDGKTYRVEMAIPTLKPFKEGDTLFFEFQINDLQNLNDAMCAVGSGYPHYLVGFTLGGATSAKLSAESNATVSGGRVKIPVMISGNSGMAGLGLEVTYDSGLTLVEATGGDALGTLAFTPDSDLTTPPVKLLFDGIDADNTNGTVVILTFEVSKDVTAESLDISINATDAYDGDTNDLTVKGTTATVTLVEYIPGDVSGDGEVDLKDVTSLRRYLAGGYNESVRSGALDTNRDGRVDLKDVTTLRRYLSGGYGVELR